MKDLEIVEKSMKTAKGMLEEIKNPENLTVDEIEIMIKEIKELRKELKADEK